MTADVSARNDADARERRSQLFASFEHIAAHQDGLHAHAIDEPSADVTELLATLGRLAIAGSLHATALDVPDLADPLTIVGRLVMRALEAGRVTAAAAAPWLFRIAVAAPFARSHVHREVLERLAAATVRGIQ